MAAAARPKPDNESGESTSVALVQQDIKYIREDIQAIKASLLSAAEANLTKNEASYKFAEIGVRVTALEMVNENEAKDRKFYKQTAIGAVISNLITLIIGAILAVRFWGGH